MKLFGTLLSLLIAVSLAASRTHAAWTVQTVSGNGSPGFSGDFGKASAAQIDNPFGVVRGPDKALWFSEYGGQRIRHIKPDGFIFSFVGNGKKALSGDGGQASGASLNLPHEIRFNPAGDLFIADVGNHAIRKVSLTSGTISCYAGTGFPGYSGDGDRATAANLRQPHSMQFGPDGNLYICDTGNHSIRKVDSSTGIISTFAGTGAPGSTPDGSPIAGTPLRGPRAIDFDKDGNLWVATRDGNQILKFELKTGLIHLVAGTGAKGFTGNGGPAMDATFSGPKGIALDPSGNVWIVDTENHAIRMINANTGHLELVCGTGEKGDGPDGDPLKCKLARPHGIFVDRDGSIYIADSEAHRIRVLKNK